MLHVHVTVITADPRVLDDLIRRIQNEVRPAVESQPGNLGVSLHVSPEGDVAMLESFWASGDDMRTGQEVVAPALEEVAQRARRTLTERYEVPVFEVEGHLGAGEGVRRTPMDLEPSQAEDAVAWYGDTAVPWLSDTGGFCGALLYVDWTSGHLISETVWRDAQAFTASRGTAEAIHTAAVEATGCVTGPVAEYRLVFSSARPY
jgi:heme-degrading monooxygenase HmoA